MQKLYCLIGFITLFALSVSAQDEGTIVKRDRLQKSNNIFIGGGPSLTFGKNIGDYSTGFNAEIGFLKRLNRVLSIGPSVSFIKFKYDPDKTEEDGNGAFVDYGDPNDWGVDYDYGYVLELKGGDISLTSLAVNIKLNFVPVKDDSKFSVYGFIKPFVTYASRTEVSGKDYLYSYGYYEDTNGEILYEDGWWYDGVTSEWGADSFKALKAETEITGGVFLGPGVELWPARGVSVFVQAAFGYTFPITFVSTSAYEPTVDDYFDEKFPMTKEGFPSLNVQAGVSFNF